MKKIILLLFASLFFGCAPEYYTPQSMFKDDTNPNKNRKEGNYNHELKKTKKIENYIPQTKKIEEIETKNIKDYVPQTQRNSLIFPATDSRFIGTWISSNPDNSKELIVITLSSNNNATTYDIDSGVKSIPVTFKWFHRNNKLGYYIDFTQYSYNYDDDLEDMNLFYDEVLNEFGFEYEWINDITLKLFDDEGSIIFEKQNENDCNTSDSDYISQTIESTYEYTPQTTLDTKNKPNHKKSKYNINYYTPQTIR
tara:strand:+ start:206 stop:964 length:759 start_codon:yes stop_codon:yes gene_type:complete